MSEKKGWWGAEDSVEADSSEKTANTDDEDHRADSTRIHPFGSPAGSDSDSLWAGWDWDTKIVYLVGFLIIWWWL